MPIFDRTLKTGKLTVCILLAAGAGTAWAQGGGASHADTSFHAPARASSSHAPTMPASLARPGPMAPAQASSHGHGAPSGSVAGAIPGTLMGPAAVTLTPAIVSPSFTAGCETIVSANCEARAESLFTATQGDPALPWTVPTPTIVPPTPAAPKIVEPLTATGPILEQSGGSSRPAIEGGGPTLADCMAIWSPDVHMTKTLWKGVCVRTLNGVNEPEVALGSEPSATPHHVHARRQARN